MIIKAITLWQPWASFMARGMKKNETRSWSTSYRGPLAIHSAKKLQKGFPGDIGMFAINKLGYPFRWPLGKVICVVELETIEKIIGPPADPIETMLGDYTPGRYLWQTKMIQVFDEPIPAQGHQCLWDWEWRKDE